MVFSKSDQPLQVDLDRAEFIRSHIPKGVHTVLDVGCGTGIVTRLLSGKYEIMGLELSSVGVRKITELGIPCQQGSIAEIPFPDRSFDLVMSCEVFEHLDDELFSQGLGEVARVASKHVLVTVPNKDRFRSLRRECPNCRTICVPWGHIRTFGVDSIRQLFDDFGFAPQEVRTFGPSVPNEHRLIRRLLRWHRWFYNPLRPGGRCPVCKYLVPGPPLGRPKLNDLITHPLLTCAHILDFLANKLSPKCQRWIIAIHERQSDGS